MLTTSARAHYKHLAASGFLILLLSMAVFSACGSRSGTAPMSGTECIPDIAVSAGLFISPPTDISNITGIVPLGNMNPGSNHVLPVDHMYLKYPVPEGGGSLSYPVYAMAKGKLFGLFRKKVGSMPDYAYQISINHTCSVSSYFDHVHGLSARIQDYLTTNAVPWYDISGTGGGPWILFLGQPGGAPMLPVDAGEQLGITKNYTGSWDVGVIDKRSASGTFANPSIRRYPNYTDLFPLLVPSAGIDMSVYGFLGNAQMNAACFIDYLSDAGGMRTDWFNMLVSTPKSCGMMGWDTQGYLQGVWFNPAIDADPWPFLDIDTSALTIIPDNFSPLMRVQIGWGTAASASVYPALALLDPATWSPPILDVDQIALPFTVTKDIAPGAVVNPDPAAVGAGMTVCYDLPYNAGTNYNYVLFHMTDSTTVKVKYDPTAYTMSKCASFSGFPPVDATWVTYIR